MMSNLKMTLEQAFDALEVSEADRSKYREMLNKGNS